MKTDRFVRLSRWYVGLLCVIRGVAQSLVHAERVHDSCLLTLEPLDNLWCAARTSDGRAYSARALHAWLQTQDEQLRGRDQGQWHRRTVLGHVIKGVGEWWGGGNGNSRKGDSAAVLWLGRRQAHQTVVSLLRVAEYNKRSYSAFCNSEIGEQ